MLKMLALCLAVAATAADAQTEDTSRFVMAKDAFIAGNAVTFSGDGATQDVFMAGQSATLSAPVLGSAHLAARRVMVDGAVGGDVFAVGYSVDVSAPVAGDANLAGFEVALASDTGGNLRAMGSEVVVGGAVGGYALVTAEQIMLNGAVAGDAQFAARDLVFGPDAKVAGSLTVYAVSPAKIIVPASVAPAARVKILQLPEGGGQGWGMHAMDYPMMRARTIWSIAASLAMGLLFTGLTALVVIALAPTQVQLWRDVARAHPWRAMFSGFLVTSALVGSGFVLALTLVGIFLFPALMVLAMVVMFAGYALGSYVLGAALWVAFGRAMPSALLGHFALTLCGAAVVSVVWLVPVLGWFFALGVTLLGVGTLAAMILPAQVLLNRGHVAAVQQG
jgi:hypothetical protein